MLRVITIAALCIDIEHIGRILLADSGRLVLNYGMAFSLLSGYPSLTMWLSVIAIVMIISVLAFTNLNEWEKFGYSLMLGGALSNCAEKFILGYVIDWIHFPFIPLTINIADIEVSLGALIALLNFVV